TGYLEHLAKIVLGAPAINFGSLGLGLPYAVWWGLQHADRSTLWVGLGLGLITFGYLYHVANQPESTVWRQADWLKLGLGGLVVFGLGSAILLTNSQVKFTSTGIGNRVAIAAAIGVAISFVGALGWVSGLLSSQSSRRRAFCLLIAGLCVGGFLV